MTQEEKDKLVLEAAEKHGIKVEVVKPPRQKTSYNITGKAVKLMSFLREMEEKGVELKL